MKTAGPSHYVYGYPDGEVPFATFEFKYCSKSEHINTSSRRLRVDLALRGTSKHAFNSQITVTGFSVAISGQTGGAFFGGTKRGGAARPRATPEGISSRLSRDHSGQVIITWG